MKAFRINIVGLSNKIHEFDFQVDKSFFIEFNSELIEDAELEVKVRLDKHETFLDAEFKISGKVSMTCDRSLEQFEEPLLIEGRILFKYASQTEEISDDIMHIAHDTDTIDLSQYIYDMIGTSMPMKRLHPRFRNEDDSEEGSIVYSSGSTEDVAVDPRWEKLKSLK